MPGSAVVAQEREALEELIVTAQKVEENIEDVPASVTVLSGDFVEELGSHNLSDLNGTTPNMIVQNVVLIQNSANISIRGIGFYDTDPFADQKTQVLVDGIPHARVTGLAHDQIDVERVEVLRGPQGTLFGRNSLAGTINVITKPASLEQGLFARATFGEFGLAKYVFAVETGHMFDDVLRSRLTVSKHQYDGHVKNAFSNNRMGVKDANSVRLKIDHSLGSALTTFTFYRNEDEVDGQGIVNLEADPNGTADGDVHLINMDTDGFNDSTEKGLTLLSDIELQTGTIALVANAHRSDFILYSDFDGRAGNVPPAPGRNPNLNVSFGFDITSAQESLELRFHDSHSDRWEYVLGMFAFQEEGRRFFFQNIGQPFSPSLAFEDAVRTTIAEQVTKSIAVFAQTDYYLNDQYTLIFGGRVTQDNKNAVVSNFGLPPPAPQRPPITLEPSATWEQPTWRLGMQYEPRDELMSYFTISTGYKAGGFTSRATVSENVGPYEPEYVTNYELGFKSNLLGNRLRLAGAAFFADYEDLVGWVRRTNSTGRTNEPVNANLGNVEIKGLEFESSWLMRSDLSLDVGLGLLDAQWVSFDVDLNNDGIVTDNSHLDLLMAPKLTAYSNLNYSVYKGENVVEFRLDVRYQSRYNSTGETNDDIVYRPGTTMWNGAVTWSWGDKGNSISLFGRNLSDKAVPRQIIGTSMFPVAVFERPRRFGLEFRLGL